MDIALERERDANDERLLEFCDAMRLSQTRVSRGRE